MYANLWSFIKKVYHKKFNYYLKLFKIENLEELRIAIIYLSTISTFSLLIFTRSDPIILLKKSGKIGLCPKSGQICNLGKTISTGFH
jgi:hypothetical protein